MKNRKVSEKEKKWKKNGELLTPTPRYIFYMSKPHVMEGKKGNLENYDLGRS